MKRILVAAIVALIFGVMASASALTGAASVFTKLDGKFRGSGIGVVGSDGKKRRISCQLTNSYIQEAGDKTSGELKMKGKCASSMGTSRVSGTISHAGGMITGTYISLRSDIQMTKSSGNVSNNSLTISSSFVDEKIGKLIKIRQIIRLSDSGFKAEFFAFDNKSKKYESAGSINFKRK